MEGTAAYLSPELVQGVATRPTIASDCWAFGCTLYQSLCGRPPLWAETQQEVMRRIVKFDGLDEEKYPEGVTEDAKELIRSLLVVEVESRLGSGVDGIDEVRRHVFFEGAGVAVAAESGGNGGGGAGAIMTSGEELYEMVPAQISGWGRTATAERLMGTPAEQHDVVASASEIRLW